VVRTLENRISTKIAIVANTAWYLANFRMNLANTLRSFGYEVIAIAPSGADVSRIEEAGIRFVPMPMDNMGTNPIRDTVLFLRLFETLRRERPAVYLGYTVKPNVYGGLACQLLGIPSVHNISGLGTAFIHNTWLTRMVRRLYRLGLRKAAKVFFQNQDDLELFLHHRLVLPAQTECLPGSGVDTRWFAPDVHHPRPLEEMENRNSLLPGQTIKGISVEHRPFRFLLSARLLWDKGIWEYIEASRQLISEGKEIECQLLGFLDVENRTAISRSSIEEWEREGVLHYVGATNDVRPFIAQADCVVLPSYREGTPRSLLEAASMGKPVITTDVVGCREVVEDRTTGLLCRPQDAKDLAEKMRRMVALTEENRIEMGRRGREKMIREFDEKFVIQKYLNVISEIVIKESKGNIL
jgi:glycosyltransferase involved in cell wall biosynthesis